MKKDPAKVQEAKDTFLSKMWVAIICVGAMSISALLVLPGVLHGVLHSEWNSGLVLTAAGLLVLYVFGFWSFFSFLRALSLTKDEDDDV